MKTERRNPAAVLAAALEGERVDGAVLFVGEDADDARTRSGLDGAVWVREAGGAMAPLPWPPEGMFVAATLRMPRAHDAYVMALHAIATRLVPGAPIYIYGPNEEGIRSAPRDLDGLFDHHESVLMRGHARVWRAERVASPEGLRTSLADWRRVQPLEFAGVKRDWVSYPGVFAQGLLDAGTALLIAQLPQSGAGAALDFGAGTGILARVLVERGFTLDMIERDCLAHDAAMRNVPQARAILNDRLVPSARYRLIVSNPPIHNGKAVDLRVLEALIAQAPQHLERGGLLLLVTQQTVPVPRLAQERFATVQCLSEAQGYRVWGLHAPK